MLSTVSIPYYHCLSDTDLAPVPDLPDFAGLAFDVSLVANGLTENRSIRSRNQTFGHLVGTDVSDVIGRTFCFFCSSDKEFEPIRDIGLTVLRQPGPYRDERLVRHRKRQNVWCRFRATALPMDAPLDRFVISFAPISDTGLLSGVIPTQTCLSWRGIARTYAARSSSKFLRELR